MALALTLLIFKGPKHILDGPSIEILQFGRSIGPSSKI